MAPTEHDAAQRGWDDAIAGRNALQAPAVIRTDPSAYTIYLYAHFEAYGALGRTSPWSPVPVNPVGQKR